MLVRSIIMRIITVLIVLMALTGTVLLSEAVGTSDRGDASFLTQSPEAAKPNGEYMISIRRGSSWVECARIRCSEFFMEKSSYLPDTASIDGPVTIKITEQGGGAAHLDSVRFEGKAPLTMNGKKDSFLLGKLSQKDYDVIDAYGKSLVFTFDGKGDGTLSLSGRIEKERITKEPFRFPLSNLHKRINEKSSFYTYRLRRSGSFAVDGKLSEVSGEKPFFKEFSLSGTGHPSGYTYGWVKDDGKNLYVAIDFTVDNTMDGDKDYAKVHVKTGKVVKEFKVSVPERRWGMPSFTHTDKVSYQHKIYEFMIPLKELGVKDGEIALAFSTYGTGAPPPGLAYGPQNNRFLTVYERGGAGGSNIYGRFADGEGNAVGNEISISTEAGNQYNAKTACDGVNNRFLVVWQDNRNPTSDIYGQRVNADGTLSGTSIVVSDDVNNLYEPSVSFNTLLANFLVVFWSDSAGLNAPVYALVGAPTPGNTAVSPDFLSFGNVFAGSASQPQTVTVSNNGGGGVITMGNLSITGDNASLFTIQNDGSSGKEIPRGEQRTAQVVFTPDSQGDKLATLNIPSNDPETPLLQIPLSGKGTSDETGNAPPTAPSLIYPRDGQQVPSTNVTFRWSRCTDQDGNSVKYHLHVGRKPDLSDAAITDVTGYVSKVGILYAGAPLMFATLVLALRRRRGSAALLIAAVIISMGLIISCSGGSGDTSRSQLTGDSGVSSIIQHTISNLDAKTTYYWKVISDDNQGGTASSGTWSFKTP